MHVLHHYLLVANVGFYYKDNGGGGHLRVCEMVCFYLPTNERYSHVLEEGGLGGGGGDA